MKLRIRVTTSPVRPLRPRPVLPSILQTRPNLAFGTPAPDPDIVALPAASEEAIRLALTLRDAHARPGGRLLMFLPASTSVNASRAVADALCGLVELREGPILVMDLRPASESSGTPEWLRDLPVDDDQSVAPDDPNACTSALIAWPFGGIDERVSYAASREFADRLADARARYTYVLCIGSDVSVSLETLITAPLVDGVVLAVAPSRMTRPQIHHLTEQLRRARAQLLGFVVEARPVHGGAR